MIRAYFVESANEQFLNFLEKELGEYLAVKGYYTFTLNPKDTLEDIEIFMEMK